MVRRKTRKSMEREGDSSGSEDSAVARANKATAEHQKNKQKAKAKAKAGTKKGSTKKKTSSKKKSRRGSDSSSSSSSSKGDSSVTLSSLDEKDSDSVRLKKQSQIERRGSAGGSGKDREETKEEAKQEEGKQQDDDDNPPPWGKSKARDCLFDLCLDPNFPSKGKIKPKEVWDQHCKDRPEFKHFQDCTKFAGRLRDQRARAGKKTGRAKEDAECLKHDRETFPERVEDAGGEPVWAGSKAQELLRRDPKDEERMKLKPKVLQTKEDECLEFSLDKFRNETHQEKKAAKRALHVKKKRAEKEARAKKAMK